MGIPSLVCKQVSDGHNDQDNTRRSVNHLGWCLVRARVCDPVCCFIFAPYSYCTFLIYLGLERFVTNLSFRCMSSLLFFVCYYYNCENVF